MSAIPKTSFQKNIILVSLITIATILFGLNAFNSRFYTGIDSTAYLSIAQQYADGNFGTAINSFWSPMIAWLIAIFIKLGIGGQAAFALVNTIIAFLILILGSLFIWKKTEHFFLAVLLYLLILSPFLLENVSLQQPDLLVALWVLTMSTVFVWADGLSPVHNKNKNYIYRASLVIGIVGGLGYLIKLFLFPFFICVTTAWLILRFIKLSQQNVKPKTNLIAQSKIASLVAAGFLIVSTPWIILLSAKYDRPTMGSAFSVTVLSRFDESLLKNYEVLPEPPNKYALSFGEDRTPPKVTKDEVNNNKSVNLESGSDKESKSIVAELRHYLSESIKAVPFYLNRISSMSPFIIPVALFIGAAILFNKVKLNESSDIYIIFSFMVIYFIGYALITRTTSGGGNVRYYWPLYILFALLVPLVLAKLMPAVNRLGRVRKTILVVIVALVPTFAFAQYIFGYYYPFSVPIANPVKINPSERKKPPRPFKTLKTPAIKLAEKIREDSPIPVGSKFVGSNYRQTLRVAFTLKGQVYGVSGRNYDYNDPALRERMMQAGVNYFIKFTPALSPRVENTPLEKRTKLGEYKHRISCTDAKDAKVEPCIIEVFKIK